MPATVVALHLTPKSRAPLTPRTEVQALERQGLEGDRHARPGSRRQVLFVEVETLEALGLAPGAIREQVTVRGIRLDQLAAGTRVRIGSAELEVAGPCDPCERMEEIRSGLRAQLEGRRGRFLSVVRAGSFSVGQPLMIETGVAPGS
jgi:MOSC domain-containing protein YiiM